MTAVAWQSAAGNCSGEGLPPLGQSARHDQREIVEEVTAQNMKEAAAAFLAGKRFGRATAIAGPRVLYSRVAPDEAWVAVAGGRQAE